MSYLRCQFIDDRFSFRFDVDLVVDDLIVGFVGDSGSGKTTFFKYIAGFINPTQGKISIKDRVFFDCEKGINLPINKRRIGQAFQLFNIFPHLTVKKNIFYGYKKHRYTYDIEPREIINTLGLEKLLSRNVMTLSGGEKQRVSLGRALISCPNLFLFDEPLSSIEDELKSKIIELILSIVKSNQIPLLYISHDTHEMSAVTSHTIAVNKGLIKNIKR